MCISPVLSLGSCEVGGPLASVPGPGSWVLLRDDGDIG
jgi:hypothetical protein